MDKNNNSLSLTSDETEFYRQVAELFVAARRQAKRQLDNIILVTYYQVGRMIVEREQYGQKRAQYGKQLLSELADYLSENIDKRYSADNLKLMCRFYTVYSENLIGESSIPQFTQNVSWTHYIQVMRIENLQERQFYEIETASNGWTVGILLCKDKSDSIVEMTLPENSNIYTSEYSLYLPDKALLQRKLAEWVEEFEETHGGESNET